MAQRDYTLPLKEATFPMLSEQQHRTIIGGADKSSAENTGTPKVYFCHNVMPSLEGLDSVGYLSVIAAATPAATDFSDTRIIYGSARTRLYLSFTAAGDIYVLKPGSISWLKLAATSPVPVNDITIGTVNGISYIYYKSTGCVQYNEVTDALDSVTLTGINTSAVIGVVASYGYLITYTVFDIAWSSTVDPTDFVPSQVTGSGGGPISSLGGEIVFILANYLGILVYTEANTIAGTYTGNVQYPFKLREVTSSKGGISLDLVAYEANTSDQFSYSKAGLQSVDSQKAELILPEVTDFLAGKRFEDFDETTKDFTVTDLTASMSKKVKFIASRYLVISYGISSFTHALVYDIALKRLGKLKVIHVDCFEYLGAQTEVSKESIAFLLADGEVKVLDFSVSATNSDGVVILGKLQYTRSRTITLQGVDVENVESSSSLSVTSLVSLDGKTTTKVAGYEKYSAENLRKYAFKVTAVNHSLLLIGKFNLTTLFITYTLNGRR